MNHLEIEYKTLLNKDEYNRLKKLFSHVSPVTQTNYYFDSNDSILKKNRMSLRIRTFQSEAEMTLKIPKDIGNFEYNHKLNIQKAKFLIKNGLVDENSVTHLLTQKGIDVSSLRSYGHLTTERREMKTSIGLMALDSNHYSNVTDYELEVEVDEPVSGEQNFRQFLDENRINFKYAKSKVARYSSTLKSFKE